MGEIHRPGWRSAFIRRLPDGRELRVIFNRGKWNVEVWDGNAVDMCGAYFDAEAAMRAAERVARTPK